MPKESDRGRVVLITGASSGIGLSCASRLVAEGYRVYGTSRKPQSQTLPFTMLTMDVTDEQSVVRGIDAILDREGHLDVVVNNAGAGLAGAIENTSLDEAKAQFDVNFFGTLNVCRAVLPGMRRQGSGYIVNVGSIGGLIAIPYQAMYSASKFALEGFTEALRLEARQWNIKVTLIEPGDHKTAFTQNRKWTAASSQDTLYRSIAEIAINRMAQDEQNGPDPARVAALLHRVVTMPNPRLRYTVGPGMQRAATWLKRFLPNSLLEYGIRRYYRLDR